MASANEGKNKKSFLIIIFCVVVIFSGILIYLKIFYNSEELIEEITSISLNENKQSNENVVSGEIIDLGILSHPKLGTLYETPITLVDYKVGNKNPFEPYE